MSDQEKKWQRVYDLLNAKTNLKIVSEIIGFLCLPYTKQKELFFLHK